VARRLRDRIDVACAVSEAARLTAVEALGGQCDVLFNGVDTDEYAQAEPRPTRGRPTALFLGRHEDRKGLGVLLEAFVRIGGPSHLWIAGSGPRSAELRLRHPPSDRLTWLGLLSEPEKASAVAGADVLVAPSLGGESFGIVLLEGMAGRCAVVASDIDGYRQASGGHAELVAPGDPGALAVALSRALEDAAAGTGSSSPAALDAAAAHAGAWSLEALAVAYEERYRIALGDGAGHAR
jgi:phosphatidylinositol alpha-mannosyltransferase